MNQQPVIDALTWSTKQQRLRHLTCIEAKHLKINATRFNVWFTLHVNVNCKAFFISEKKESDRSPKWTFNDVLSRHSFKQFVIRIWYSNFEDANLKQKSTGIATSRLNLLFEMCVNMDYLVPLNETSLKLVTKSPKSYPNFIFFEVFGQIYAETFVEVIRKRNNTQSVSRVVAHISQQSAQATITRITPIKKSYTLNSMIRIHDFQRVIQETQQKIVQLKVNSLNKFEQLTRLRQLQIRREELQQRISIYRDTLTKAEKRNAEIRKSNVEIEAKKREISKHLERFDLDVFQVEKKKYAHLEKICEFTSKTLDMNLNQLKQRQRQLIIDLFEIFKIETVNVHDAKRNSIMDPMITSLPANFRQNTKLKMLNASLVINKMNLFVNGNGKTTNGSNDMHNAHNEVTNDEQNSIALGYLVHAVQNLSNILCVPLKYPLLFRSSRSYIVEQVNEYDSRKLPLFKSNVVSGEVFFYAVSLLNINLIQLKVFTDKRFLNLEQQNNLDLLLNLKTIFEYFTFKRVSQ